MDLYCSQAKSWIKRILQVACAGANTYALLLSAYPAEAQVAPPLLLDDVSIKTNQRAEGSAFQVDLPDGTRCSSTNGSPPTLSFYGGTSTRKDDYEYRLDSAELNNASSGGHAAGAVVTIPLGTRNNRNCDKSYQLHILTQKLELATLLYDQGLIEKEDLDQLLNHARQFINEAD